MGWTNPKTWADGNKIYDSELNEQVRDNLDFLKENIALEAPAELTIAVGVVTKTKAYHTIDTEGDIASDDLDTINGGNDGDIIFLQAKHDARTVIIKDGTGNIHCGGDIYLDDAHKLVELMYDATLAEWHPIGAYAMTREFAVNEFEYPLPGTDWTPSLLGSTLAQNKAGKICWIPLSCFKIGDIFVSYKLVGDAVEAAALTLDCKLVRVNKADPITSTDIVGGAIVQVDADGNFDVEATLGTPEVIATDKQYLLQITATTGAGDSFIVMGAEVKLIRLL